LIRRDALVMSGWSTPTPAQNSFMPPPVPVLSMIGVLNLLLRPNSSATAVANGYTVEEPTIRIWSRAAAGAAASISAAAAVIERRVRVTRDIPSPPVVFYRVDWSANSRQDA
jgi:hypothetical protein